jgi:hypothetical protein
VIASPDVRRAVRAALLALTLAGGGLAAAACAKPRPVPLSVQLQGEPRIVRTPIELFRNANGTSLGVGAGPADAFYGRLAPTLERWGVDIRIIVEPAYVGAIIVKGSALDSLAVSPAGALGLAQLTPAVDAELRRHSAAYPWMAAEVASWPRDPAVHGAPSPGTDDSARPIAPAAVRARLAAGTLTARNEYLFDAERSARAAMFWVKLLQDRWTREGAAPGDYAAFARRTLANGGAPSDDQVLDLVTVSYRRGHAWTRTAVERLGRDWVRRLPELGAEGADAADFLGRVRLYTRLLGGDPTAIQAEQQRRR